MQIEEEKFYTVEEVAKKMRVAASTVYRMAQKGEIPAIKFGRAWRFSERKLAEFLEKQSNP